MDLYAHSQIDKYEAYVKKHYGEPPRLRGICFMKLEKPYETDGSYQTEVYNSYCGKDVVYVHTRCGSSFWGDGDPDANYIACGGMEWEEANGDTFIESMNDEFDGTYRDHYFHAVIDEEYESLVSGAVD